MSLVEAFRRSLIIAMASCGTLVAQDKPEVESRIIDFNIGAMGAANAPGVSPNSVSNEFDPLSLQLGVASGMGYSVHRNIRLTWDMAYSYSRKKAFDLQGERYEYTLPQTLHVGHGLQFRSGLFWGRNLVFGGGGVGLKSESDPDFGRFYGAYWQFTTGGQTYIGKRWGVRYEARYLRLIGDPASQGFYADASVNAVISIFFQLKRQ